MSQAFNQTLIGLAPSSAWIFNQAGGASSVPASAGSVALAVAGGITFGVGGSELVRDSADTSGRFASSAYATASSSAATDIPATTPCTMLAVFRLSREDATGHTLLSTLDSGSGFKGRELRVESTANASRLTSFLIDDFGSSALQVRSAASVPTGSVILAIVTHDGSRTPGGLKLFINAVPMVTTTPVDTLSADGSPDTASGLPVRIGARLNGSENFGGDFHAAAIWNSVALTEEQITTLWTALNDPDSITYPTTPFDLAAFTGLRAAVKTKCLDNNIKAASGQIDYEFIGSGPPYNGTVFGSDLQAEWDSVFNAILALGYEGYGDNAQLWLTNWRDHQNEDGFLPNFINTGDGGYFGQSQPPIQAYGAWKVYRETADAAWLADQYAMLEAEYAAWSTIRDDATGLASWGSLTAVGDENIRTSAGYESGQDRNGPWNEGLYMTGIDSTPKVLDACCPSLNAMLAVEADSLALIAFALGNSSDATTYRAAAAARRAAMNAYMWDEDAGCYQWTCRDEYAVDVGELSASATAGATAVSLTLTLTANVQIPHGAVLEFTPPTGPVTTAQHDGHDRTGNLLTPLPSALASGTTVRWRRTVYCPKQLSQHAYPLWAGVPTYDRAERIIDEHLNLELDGSADRFEWYPGSSYYKSALIVTRHVAWAPQINFGTLSADGLTYSASVATQMARFVYRNIDSSELFSSPDVRTERATEEYPISVNVTFDVPTSGTQLRVIFSNNQSVALSTVTVATTEPEGTTVTKSVPYSGTVEMGIVDIYSTGGSNPLKVRKVEIVSRPRGENYRTPYGYTSTARFGRYYFSTPYVSTRKYSGDNSTSAVYTQIEGLDYWRGDIWINQQFWLVHGLLRYGYFAEAQEAAKRAIYTVNAEHEATGEMWERFGCHGAGKGGTGYVWTGLAVRMVDQLSVASPSFEDGDFLAAGSTPGTRKGRRPLSLTGALGLGL